MKLETGQIWICVGAIHLIVRSGDREPGDPFDAAFMRSLRPTCWRFVNLENGQCGWSIPGRYTRKKSEWKLL